MDIEKVEAYDNKIVLDIGDHSGDCEIVFFNNQWHMFMDEGEHLHYKIAYAVTSPDNFPLSWKLSKHIYGPYNPDKGETFDDDNDQGNKFGTGDAAVALEGTTIYMFTERPIGVAYKEGKAFLPGDPGDLALRAFILESGEQRSGAEDIPQGVELDQENFLGERGVVRAPFAFHPFPLVKTAGAVAAVVAAIRQNFSSRQNFSF